MPEPIPRGAPVPPERDAAPDGAIDEIALLRGLLPPGHAGGIHEADDALDTREQVADLLRLFVKEP